jgi:hypothetical protein
VGLIRAASKRGGDGRQVARCAAIVLASGSRAVLRTGCASSWDTFRYPCALSLLLACCSQAPSSSCLPPRSRRPRPRAWAATLFRAALPVVVQGILWTLLSCSSSPQARSRRGSRGARCLLAAGGLAVVWSSTQRQEVPRRSRAHSASGRAHDVRVHGLPSWRQRQAPPPRPAPPLDGAPLLAFLPPEPRAPASRRGTCSIRIACRENGRLGSCRPRRRI